jgi:hypothetical protein
MRPFRAVCTKEGGDDACDYMLPVCNAINAVLVRCMRGGREGGKEDARSIIQRNRRPPISMLFFRARKQFDLSNLHETRRDGLRHATPPAQPE